MYSQNPRNDNEQTAVEKRFTSAAVAIHQNLPGANDIAFMQAGLCHAFFPHKDPGDDLEIWVRQHGNYILTMQPTMEYNPLTNQAEKFGLPWGAKPRLMLALLNTVALKQKSPELHLGNSLTDFIGQYLGFDTNGRTIREVKNQMARLAAADIKVTYNMGNEAGQGHTGRSRVNIIRDLDIWWTKDINQRHFWGNTLRFSDDYFNDIKEHGVPLDLRALRALSNTSMGLDLYSFMAHRLHALSKPVPISWKAVKDQFGAQYEAMNDFKKEFRRRLLQVHQLYPEARFEEVENRGIILYPSKPAVPGKVQFVVPAFEPIINPFAGLAKRKAGRDLSKKEKQDLQREIDASIQANKHKPKVEIKRPGPPPPPQLFKS